MNWLQLLVAKIFRIKIYQPLKYDGTVTVITTTVPASEAINYMMENVGKIIQIAEVKSDNASQDELKMTLLCHGVQMP